MAASTVQLFTGWSSIHSTQAPQFDVRAAVTRTLSRPDYFNLVPFERINTSDLTLVRGNPDLRHATVYYSVLGDPEDSAETQEALDHAAPYVQSVVARQVRLKYIPKLHFALDDTIERAMRINRILHDIHEEE